jgi:hypothetical protein
MISENKILEHPSKILQKFVTKLIRLENFITHFGYVCGRSGHPFS